MNRGTYLLLCGGVGGSKLADGLSRILQPDELSIVVNTADDFRHLGLQICPDLDTVTYMLAGLIDHDRGWGRKDESWSAMEAMRVFGGPSWFNLGDRDLALHLWRTLRVDEGRSLSQVTDELASRLGIRHAITPMSDDTVQTIIETNAGDLGFQEYFVHQRCAPVATGYRYEGVDKAKPTSRFLSSLADPNLRGIIIAPSNPFLSIGPIIELSGVRAALLSSAVPRLAVSPLVAGKALKGPVSKLLGELGYHQDARGVMSFYDGLLNGFMFDERDPQQPISGGVELFAGDLLMQDEANRVRVAQLALDLVDRLHQN